MREHPVLHGYVQLMSRRRDIYCRCEHISHWMLDTELRCRYASSPRIADYHTAILTQKDHHMIRL